MRDVLLAGGWLGVLGLGGGLCAWLFRLGLPRTYVRDLLHVGAGVWVFGWPLWSGWWVPSLIPLLAVVGLALLGRSAPAAPRPTDAERETKPSTLDRFRGAVSDADERWSGLVLYALSVAVLTPVGLLWRPFPAAAALLALALGDGLGGLVGRRFGRHRFRLPGAKPKSVEGALMVALASAGGVWLAALYFQAPVTAKVLLLAGAASALAEALAPRASDNVLVPLAVFALLAWSG